MSSDYTLGCGTHETPDDGRCAMEWVNHLAGEPRSDQPGCVSPVLRALCTGLNDGLEDDPRQRLRPNLSRTIGTAGDRARAAARAAAADAAVSAAREAVSGQRFRGGRAAAKESARAALAPTLEELRGSILALLERDAADGANRRAARGPRA